MKTKKNGRAGKDEVRYILENIPKIGLRAVSETLNRPIETIERICLQNGLAPQDGGGSKTIVPKSNIISLLESSPEWNMLKEEFSKDEVEFFKHRYSRYVAQFKDDILDTEDTQLFQLIKFEILTNRCLKETNKLRSGKIESEKQVAKILGKRDIEDLDDINKRKVRRIEETIIQLRKDESNCHSEYVKLQEKVSMILKELKGTREQRISKVDNNKFDFIGLIKQMANEKFRIEAGEALAYVNMSVENEKKRLSQPHEYVNKEIDMPLLTPETVLEDNENNE